MATNATIPGRYCFNKLLLSAAVIGILLVLSISSSSDGGGTFSKPYTHIISGNAKTNPVQNGTQNSAIWY